MVCIPKNDFQVLEYDAASGQACVYDLYLYKGGYNDDGITVKLVVDPSVLDVYNVENRLELKVMPDRYFAFDPEVRLSGDRVRILNAKKYVKILHAASVGVPRRPCPGGLLLLGGRR